jgi:hypothetical protein
MDEFDDVISLLRDNRPEATELELDQIKQRVRKRAAQPARRKQDMKSRLAILLMLVAGGMFSTVGAGLALSGPGSDASVAEYETPTPTPPGGVLGEEDQSSDDVQQPRQVESGDSTSPSSPSPTPPPGNELPFTGFLALPILLGGVVLLSAGFVLRRRTRSDS